MLLTFVRAALISFVTYVGNNFDMNKKYPCSVRGIIAIGLGTCVLFSNVVHVVLLCVCVCVGCIHTTSGRPAAV